MEIKSIDDAKNLINSKKLVFLEFYTTWCAPCKLLSARINVDLLPLLTKHSDIEYAFMNVEISPEVCKWTESVGMEVVPSIAVFKNGTQIAVNYMNLWRNILIELARVIRGNHENIVDIIREIIKKELGKDL